MAQLSFLSTYPFIILYCASNVKYLFDEFHPLQRPRVGEFAQSRLPGGKKFLGLSSPST